MRHAKIAKCLACLMALTQFAACDSTKKRESNQRAALQERAAELRKKMEEAQDALGSLEKANALNDRLGAAVRIIADLLGRRKQALFMWEKLCAGTLRGVDVKEILFSGTDVELTFASTAAGGKEAFVEKLKSSGCFDAIQVISFGRDETRRELLRLLCRYVHHETEGDAAQGDALQEVLDEFMALDIKAPAGSNKGGSDPDDKSVLSPPAALAGSTKDSSGAGPDEEKLAEEIAELEKALRIAERKRWMIEKMKDEMVHKKAQLEQLQFILPLTLEKSRFFEKIASVAKRTNLRLKRLDFLRRDSHETYDEHVAEAGLSGLCQDLTAFLKEFSGLAKIVTVRRMRLSCSRGIFPNCTIDGELELTSFTSSVCSLEGITN